MTLVIHPQTQKQLKRFSIEPSHALLIVAPRGSGKRTLARHLAEQLLGLADNLLDDYPYKLFLSPLEGKSIGVEAVRELEHFLSLKVPGHGELNRVVIIEDAQTMTTEAQNALLKILEEPPAGTLLLLTATNSQAVLPTVRSRTQLIDLLTPNYHELESYFASKGYDTADIKRLANLSGGLPGLMDALLSDQEHPLRLATDKARQLLSQSNYERLLIVEELTKDRALLVDTLFIMQQMAQVSLRTASGPAARRWQKVLETAYEATKQLNNSGQPKLVLTNLILSL